MENFILNFFWMISPPIFVFVILFALFRKLNFFNDKNVELIISLAIALITFGVGFFTDFLFIIMSKLIIGLVIFLVMYLLVGLFLIQGKFNQYFLSFFGVIIFFGVLYYSILEAFTSVSSSSLIFKILFWGAFLIALAITYTLCNKKEEK